MTALCTLAAGLRLCNSKFESGLPATESYIPAFSLGQRCYAQKAVMKSVTLAAIQQLSEWVETLSSG